VSNHDKGSRVPIRWEVAITAAVFGAVSAVLIVLIATLPEGAPSWWDWAGITAYGVLAVLEGLALGRMIGQRWTARYWVAEAAAASYVDRDGAGLTVEEVRAVYCPLEPIYGEQEMTMECVSCAGTGAGGPASGPETNGRCWDCLGEGRTTYVPRRIDP
jgi:hypothetical protein